MKAFEVFFKISLLILLAVITFSLLEISVKGVSVNKAHTIPVTIFSMPH